LKASWKGWLLWHGHLLWHRLLCHAWLLLLCHGLLLLLRHAWLLLRHAWLLLCHAWLLWRQWCRWCRPHGLQGLCCAGTCTCFILGSENIVFLSILNIFMLFIQTLE
jgi:hypothetical protein